MSEIKSKSFRSHRVAERPEWAGEMAYMGPVEGASLRFTGKHKGVVLPNSLTKIEALTGWGELMFKLTDGRVENFRTDLVHDVITVSGFVDAVLDEVPSPYTGGVVERVGQELEFIYVVRKFGTHIWSLNGFPSAYHLDSAVSTILGDDRRVGKEEWLYSVALSYSHDADNWMWLAEECEVGDPRC